VDHLVLVGLDVFKDVFTFEILDCEEGRVEGDSDLVEDCHQRPRPSEARERGESGGMSSRDARSRPAQMDGEWDGVK